MPALLRPRTQARPKGHGWLDSPRSPEPTPVALATASQLSAYTLDNAAAPLDTPVEATHSEERLPYRLNHNFLTPAEATFFRVLQRIVPQSLMLCPKVNLRDLFMSPANDNTARNRIDRKHVDFVLADLETLRPVCGIELDDRSHVRPDRQARDRFVEAVFATADLPLLRVPVSRKYDTAVISAQLYQALERAPRGAAKGRTFSYPTTPECPKCRVPMVRRSTKGGRHFFGCANFPRCMEAA